MKKNLIYFLVLLLFPAVLAACSEDDLSSTSVIQPPQVVQNDFDRWLDRHYLAPYNIEFQYRYTDIESSMGYYLTPADYNQSIALAKLVIALCLEPYDEVTGSRDFIRAYFPKIIFLTGSPAYKSNGSIILGTAEGGKKITLFNVDALQIASIDASTNYFKTIHHEFGHILNQTKPYTTDFKEITGTLYVGDSCWDTYKTDASALQVGLISRYAGSEDTEDFVELISIYVTRPQEAGTNCSRRPAPTVRPSSTRNSRSSATTCKTAGTSTSTNCASRYCAVRTKSPTWIWNPSTTN